MLHRMYSEHDTISYFAFKTVKQDLVFSLSKDYFIGMILGLKNKNNYS